MSRELSLAPLTTFRLGGPAAVFLRAESLDDLAALAVVLRGAPVPLLIVGRGSNMLVADGGWPGIVLHLGQRFRRVEVEGTELEAGGRRALPGVAARSAKASLGGIAFAVAIPGTVGGGVRMNAGAHGSELADRLVWADVFHLTGDPAGRAVRMKPDELGFGYRRSALPAGAVVTAARFALTPAPEATVRAEIDEARRWRRDNQPVNQPNCGSVFANPPEMAAGRVVRAARHEGRGPRRGQGQRGPRQLHRRRRRGDRRRRPRPHPPRHAPGPRRARHHPPHRGPARRRLRPGGTGPRRATP